MFRGGRVLTLAGDTRAEAVAVSGGRIAHVGSDAEAMALARAGTEVIELDGRMLLPGIHDAHLHPLSGGHLLTAPTLGYRRLDKPQFLEAIAGLLARSAHEEPDGWLCVELWEATAMDEQPTREDLDRLPTSRPILVISLDGHIALASSRALAIGGVGASTPDPAGGRIVRGPDGEPTGILLDTALDLVAGRLPERTAEQDATALRAAHEELVRQGVTSYMDASATAQELAALAAVAGDGPLPIRPSAAILVGPELAAEPAAMLAFLDDLRATYARPGVALRTVKLFFDGVIEHPTQTAALLEPYLVDRGAGHAPRWEAGPSRGPTYFEPALADRAVAALDAAGWQVHVHAIGDRATRSALDAFAYARERNGRTGNRHTIAHLQLVHPADLDRFASLEVLANMQLQWARRDLYTVEHLEPVPRDAAMAEPLPRRGPAARRRDAVRRQRLARRSAPPLRADRDGGQPDGGRRLGAAARRAGPEPAGVDRDAHPRERLPAPSGAPERPDRGRPRRRPHRPRPGPARRAAGARLGDAGRAHDGGRQDRPPSSVKPPAIDAALARRLVDGQFPQWSDLPIAPVAFDGWDNRTFRLGSELTVRLPSGSWYAQQVEKEQRWLPVLAPQLPLPIPAPVARVSPAPGSRTRGRCTAGSRATSRRRRGSPT